MNLYIIAQYLDLNGAQVDRLLKVGQECIKRGHDVTVFTSNRAADLDLGDKRIGLRQKNGLKIITFNVPLEREMGALKKGFAFFKFARMTSRQGKQLPPPDVILTVSPPLTAALPAMNLSKYYSVPLVAEIRELWPDGPVERGTLKNGIVIKAAVKLEQQLYEKADRIVALDEPIAGRVKERFMEQAKLAVIEEDLSDDRLIEQYEQVLREITSKE